MANNAAEPKTADNERPGKKLADLHGEIRNKVYKPLLPQDETICVERHEREPALLKVNQQIRRECQYLYYIKNYFCLTNTIQISKFHVPFGFVSGFTLKNFLDQNGQQTFQMVLAVVLADEVPNNLRISFLQRDKDDGADRLFQRLDQWAKTLLGPSLNGKDLEEAMKEIDRIGLLEMPCYLWPMIRMVILSCDGCGCYGPVKQPMWGY